MKKQVRMIAICKYDRRSDNRFRHAYQEYELLDLVLHRDFIKSTKKTYILIFGKAGSRY